ncbi:ABC transporter permease [Spiroplasma endosymbiont of Othius punctulatus]|uniref:ABC transporter permease n=1 Tax=Spiroplasma endosymbiont of Othius punctulatus TaxID=3066289 RepID=UPI0030D40C27
MKSKRLLLKNAFRSSWKGKTQLIGISLLVMLMTIILSLVTSSYEQINKKNTHLNQESNLRDGIFDVQNSRRVQSVEDGEKKLVNNQTYLFQYWFNKMVEENNYDLTWSRTEARSFSKLDSQTNDQKFNMKVVTKTSPTENVNVDSLVISGGSNFSNNMDVAGDREMIVNENFAKLNNIKIGDIIRVEKDSYGSTLLVKNSDKLDANLKEQLENKSAVEFLNNNPNNAWFHIVGFGTSADFATPITDQTTVFPDAASNFIAYVKPKNFGLEINKDDNFVVFDQTKSLLYGTEFGKESYISFEYNSKRHNISEMYNKYNEKIGVLKNNKIAYLNNDSTYMYSSRVLMFGTVITAYNTITILLFLVTTFIAMFALSIVLKKRVEAVKSQMGCLKALGYWKKEILLNFVAIPAITATIGVTLGYMISIGISFTVISTFSTFFAISFGSFTFSIASFFSTWIVGFILLTFIASMLILVEIKKPALTLLKGKNSAKHSVVGMFIKSAFKKSNFDTRLRMSIFAGSWVKFLGTFVTILASSILITFTSITPTIIAKNETASFDGMDYKFVTEYQQPIAENPLSFYKTFNPNHKKTDVDNKYGYVANKKVDDYISPSKKYEVYSPLPLNEEKTEIDYKVLFDDLISGNISRYNYSPNILLDDAKLPGLFGSGGSASSRMAYLNYQMLTESFLDALDKFEFNINSMAKNTLKQQWTDLILFENEIKNIGDLTVNENLNKYIETIHNFYKKYIKGLPITINKKLILDNEIIDKQLISQMKKSSIFTKMKNVETTWETIVSELTPINLDSPEVSQDIVFLSDFNEGKGIDLMSTPTKDLLENEEYKPYKKQLAVEMAAWFNLFFEGRISMYLMQTAYSRAPYFVQENIKNAIVGLNNPNEKNKSEFSISFNVVPFDPNYESKGTMLKTKVKDNIGINVYGLSEDDNLNLIELENSNGDNLRGNLFNSIYKEPIIINESFSKLLNAKVGDSVFLDIERNVLKNSNGDIVSADINQKISDVNNYTPYSNYVSESSRSYQSTAGKNFVDSATELLHGSVTPVQIDGKSISANDALTSTGQTKINESMAEGGIYGSSEVVNKRFVVAGVQKSFGQPQAWTDNNIADEIMNFDDSRDVIFENWFKNFDLPSNQILEFVKSKYDLTSGIEITPEEIEKVRSEILGNNYLYLYSKASSQEKFAPVYNDYLTIFENTYPIFNYKYSRDPIHNDIQKSMATTSSNGDFSAVGLNGAFGYKPASDECVPEEGEKECPPVPDPDNFIEGYAVGATAMSVPMDQARLILSQMTDLVKMITIMFIVFAMIISSIIILLVTSIVISENSQFIATMKLLGYRKRYIIWQIISIYLIAILIAYAIGFTTGWFSFVGVTNMLAQGGSWILPVSFEIWMPFMVAGLLSIVFLLTFYAAYEKIRKLTPVQALDS